MVDAGIERREEYVYCALPAIIEGFEMPRQIREAYQALDEYLGSKGLDERGPSIIRYRRSSEDGPLDLEIGWIMPSQVESETPFVSDVLPAGQYVVGWHNGAYARIAEVTRELIAWGEDQRVAWDVAADSRGEAWGSWYEMYLSEPSYGPEGPTGAVEVCLRIRE